MQLFILVIELSMEFNVRKKVPCDSMDNCGLMRCYFITAHIRDVHCCIFLIHLKLIFFIGSKFLDLVHAQVDVVWIQNQLVKVAYVKWTSFSIWSVFQTVTSTDQLFVRSKKSSVLTLVFCLLSFTTGFLR